MQKTGVYRFLPWWILLLSGLVLLIWVSLTSSPPRVIGSFFAWDKLQHALAYGVLTLLAGMAFRVFPVKGSRRWLWAFIFTMVCGGLLEAAQGLFTKVRAAELGDLLANVVGSVLVFLLFRTRI